MGDSEANIVKQSDISLVENQLPPSYERVTASISSINNQQDQPPSYDSVFSRLKRAKNDSNNPYEYVNNVGTVFCSSASVTISFALGIALPIAMLAIGLVYQNDCNIDSKIPIWLIGSGAIGCIHIFIRTIINSILIYKKRSDPNYEVKCKSILTCTLDAFMFAWFICGNVWVYRVHNYVSFNPADESIYCHPTCYLFSFWLITVTWILTGLGCCCCCALVCLFSLGQAV